MKLVFTRLITVDVQNVKIKLFYLNYIWIMINMKAVIRIFTKTNEYAA